MTRRRLLALAPLLLLAKQAAAQDMPHEMHGDLPDTGGVDPEHDARVLAVTEHLGCLCGCGHRQVSDCECGTAQHIRAEVAGLVSKGTSHDAIMGAMTDEYGDEILRELPMSGFNLVAWFGPFAAVAGVGVWVWFALTRWKKPPSAPTAGSGATGAGAKPVDPYLERVEQELRE